MNTEHIKQPRIIMYSRATCVYCLAARSLLKARGLKWDEISLDREPDRYREMLDRSGRQTVPQIFIDDHHVGGFDDLQALVEKGALEHILEQGTT